jgi:hypothetical protein
VRKIAKVAAGVAVVYFVVLVAGGLFGGGCVKRRLTERLAKTLDAEVSIGDVSLSLVRGRVELRDLVIERKTGAHMRIEIDQIVADTAPLGWMLFDREARDVLVRDADISLSAAGAVALRNVKAPVMKIRKLRLDDVRLHVAPTALMPVLGAVDVTIDSATTAPVEVRSALSWIFAIRELQAKLDAPGGVSVGVGYGAKMLKVDGSLFGSTPLAVPFELPVPDPTALELAQLRDVATRLATALGKQTVENWLKEQVDRVKELIP